MIIGVVVAALGIALGVRSALPGEPPSTGVLLERALPERPDLGRVTVKVEKTAYRLTVLYDGKPVKAYPVVFGRNPADDKLREGDGCTPEGDFHLIGHRDHRLWTHFLWIDYPTQRSWKRFRQAQRASKLPKQATIGGEIGIHGVPDGRDEWVDKRVNWTAGCISLKTADIRELYRFTRIGTPVTIVH